MREQTPPVDIEAERRVLECLLHQDGAEAAREVGNILSAGDFYKAVHGQAYAIILKRYDAGLPVDDFTIQNYQEIAHDHPKIGDLPTIPYLEELRQSSTTGSPDVAIHFAKRVKKAAEIRRYESAIRKQLLKIEQWQPEHPEIALTELRDELLNLSAIGEDHGDPVSLSDMLSEDMQDPPMIVGRGVLPAEGYSMLAAMTKVGKTTLAVQMCLSIASGTEFLGFPIESRPNVLYCYLENTPQGMSKLARQQMDGWGAPIDEEDRSRIFMQESRGLLLEKKSGIDTLRAWIEKAKAGLVIIDPLSKTMSRDINKLENVTAFINDIDKIRTDIGQLAFLFIHHYGKPTMVKRQPIQQMLGSSAWGIYTESFIGMQRWSGRRPATYKRLSFELRHGPTPEEICIYLDPDCRVFELVENAEDIPSANAARVGEILRDYGQPASHTLLKTHVEFQLGIGERHAAALIREALKNQIIYKGQGKRGKYFTKDMYNTSFNNNKILHI